MNARSICVCMMLLWSSTATTYGESAPRLLAEGNGAKAPKQPQAFVGPDGTVDVVFSVGDEIRLHTSHDRGETFKAATASMPCRNLASGMRRGPRVVRTKTAVIVTAIGGTQGGGKDGDLLAWRSTDDGASWSQPVRVNESGDAAREGLHGMCVLVNGEVACVWLDLRSGKTEVYMSISENNGQNWKPNVRVYRSPDGSVCECCHPSVVAGPKGSTAVLFRNSLGGERDMYLATSQDEKSFAIARKLGNSSWKLDACPMDGGMLASDGREGLVTVWRREGGVFATFTDGSLEHRLGPGQQPWAAWSAAGPILVWTQGREGSLSLQMGKTGSPHKLASKARDPMVASHPTSEFAVVCWESQTGNDRQVMIQLVGTPANQRSKSTTK